jgi:hypothetical protein
MYGSFSFRYSKYTGTSLYKPITYTYLLVVKEQLPPYRFFVRFNFVVVVFTKQKSA